MEKFKSQFVFDSSKALFVGVEREYFITNSEGVIVPKAKQILDCAGVDHYPAWENYFPDRIQDERFGYELSACQIESRTFPCQITELGKELVVGQRDLEEYLCQASRKGGIKLNLSCVEVAPETMPLDVYPDPSGRYQEIVKKMPREILLAACRVIGTHVHIGMPDHETTLRVYNSAIKHVDELCKLGDKSNGERLEIYKIVAPDFMPPPYSDWQVFYETAVKKGFDSDPRKCWNLIRISKHGTIEFRMFGTTDDLDEITKWAEKCHSICKKYLI